MTVQTETHWEYIEGSGNQPYRNRGYYTRQYRLIGPTTREEALVAVKETRDKAWPVETYDLVQQLEDGSWLVNYSCDSTD